MKRCRSSAISMVRYLLFPSFPPVGRLIAITGKRVPELREICRITADLAGLRRGLETKRGPNGRYSSLEFSIVLRFGSTSLEPSIVWYESVRVAPHSSFEAPS